MNSSSATAGAGTELPAALPRVGRGSLSDEVSRTLLTAILDRTFPNDRLPSEPELALQLGVSRTTVRGALHSLELLGVIGRTPGRGTTLRPHVGRDCITLNRLIGFKGLLESRHDDVRVEQTYALVDKGSDDATAALGLGDDAAVVLNEKTIFAAGRPAVLLLQEVPASHVAPATLEAIGEGRWPDQAETIFDFSQHWPGRTIDHSVVELVPQVAPPAKHAARALPVRPGQPYLALHEVHYSDTNEKVAFTREVIDDDLLRLKLVRLR
ncbi:GntR family transcriptional regulator [Georgenia sp. Z1491]|uniref:GntR family transcriptional regulator n=1 Tax=Georgenia sp. Z1491 TaxID=3416707 RepID=UPI003CF95238